MKHHAFNPRLPSALERVRATTSSRVQPSERDKLLKGTRSSCYPAAYRASAYSQWRCRACVILGRDGLSNVTQGGVFGAARVD